MRFDASPFNMNSILSVEKRYEIPRNQREFSWERIQLEELWTDVLRNIDMDNDGVIKLHEYFIGTIVLSGVDSDDVLEVVDGQQRLSVITMMLSIISRYLRKNRNEGTADNIYKKFIVTINNSLDRNSMNSDGESVIQKLTRSVGGEYFKKLIQGKEESDAKPANDEEKKIRYAVTFFKRALRKKPLCSAILKSNSENFTKADYDLCLNAIYKMITNYLYVVRIAVDRGDDAYDIFEVLNARGINLSSIDLIKNKVFQSCTVTFPEDEARRKWVYIYDQLGLIGESMTDYIRCWWLSKYGYIGEDQLYRSFKREILNPESQLTADSFLDEIYSDVDLYIKIASPSQKHWNLSHQKPILDALTNINTFNVTVPRPFILSLLRIRRDNARLLKQADLINTLQFLERFHFKFNAVCRMRPSGIDSKYSVFAVKLSVDTSKADVRTTILEATDFLKRKAPSERMFKDCLLKNIEYKEDKLSQRKLIIYIFETLEMLAVNTKELKYHMVSIEHIGSQSNFSPTYVGKLGNLLPLCFDINRDCENLPLAGKLPEYTRSRLELVKQFCSDNASKPTWNVGDAQQRQEDIANILTSSFFL
ncbi:DUF262 domain-containing protein [Rahnella inusitata]|uniref:DUF262 domain-containing protein n=2 Tax=Rahnella inusitata TaxID=58169 RepID=UPI0039BE4AFA